MTEPVSNVMLVITNYSAVNEQALASVDADWCLELAASVDCEPVQGRAKCNFETLAVHPTRKFAMLPATAERRSINSPYFKLLVARARRAESPRRSTVSSLKMSLKPSCRAYLNLDEQRSFGVRNSNKKLRELVCNLNETPAPTAPVVHDAVRHAQDPLSTNRLQAFVIGQPVLSPA